MGQCHAHGEAVFVDGPLLDIGAAHQQGHRQRHVYPEKTPDVSFVPKDERAIFRRYVKLHANAEPHKLYHLPGADLLHVGEEVEWCTTGKVEDPIPVDRGVVGARGIVHLDRYVLAPIGYESAEYPRQRNQQLGECAVMDVMHGPFDADLVVAERSQEVVPSDDRAQSFPVVTQNLLEYGQRSARHPCLVAATAALSVIRSPRGGIFVRTEHMPRKA